MTAERRETFGCLRDTRWARRIASKTRVNALMTRHVRRLRGALRPMTRRTIGGNNATISTISAASVPIVSGGAQSAGNRDRAVAKWAERIGVVIPRLRHRLIQTLAHRRDRDRLAGNQRPKTESPGGTRAGEAPAQVDIRGLAREADPVPQRHGPREGRHHHPAGRISDPSPR